MRLSFKTFRSWALVYLLLFLPFSRVLAQDDCVRTEYHPPDILAELNQLFSGFSPVQNFSLSIQKNRCSYMFESTAKAPSDYLQCLNWNIHENLQHIGLGVIAGVEANDGEYALLGSDNFGLRESISILKVNQDRDSLVGIHGLIIYLLDVPLRLPRQQFVITREILPGNLQRSTWRWNDFQLDVALNVPISLGTMNIAFTSSFATSKENTNRTAMYSSLKPLFMNQVWDNDWDWYTNSSYYDMFDCYHLWGIDISSPAIGVSAGGLASAELKFLFEAQIDGSWEHADPHKSESRTNEVECVIFTWNRLEAGAAANARIRGTIKVLGVKVSKEWTIIEISSEAGRELDGPDGLKIVAFSVPKQKPPLPGKPCSTNVTKPPIADWMNEILRNPPVDKPPERPTNLARFGEELTEAVKERYYLCDSVGNPFDPNRSEYVQQLLRRDEIKRIPKDELCELLKTYLDKNLFLCERICDRVCRLKGKITECTPIRK